MTVDADAGAADDASVDLDAGATPDVPPATTTPTTSSSAGCSCSATGARPSSGLAGAMSLAALALTGSVFVSALVVVCPHPRCRAPFPHAVA